MSHDRSTSLAVQMQYEEHPYPVWDVLPEFPVSDARQYLLYAGCGTGREALAAARSMPNSDFVAIDLSAASLEFARSKANEYGINNVQFLQLDILDVGNLRATFDGIISIGVIHHMDDPLKGLLALKAVLREGGSIKFGVYSKLARRATLAAIELRKSLDVLPTDDGIEKMREIIQSLPIDHPAAFVRNSKDFESIAGTRDLLFHPKEHNFTIPELVDLAFSAGLEIVKWGPPAAVNKLKSIGYEPSLDWRVWHEAEQKKPSLFAGSMYVVTTKPLR